jgi:hypothetical protein
MYNIVNNPIPKNELWKTHTLDAIRRRIEMLPANEQALAYDIFTLTLNSCHQLVEDKILSREIFCS